MGDWVSSKILFGEIIFLVVTQSSGPGHPGPPTDLIELVASRFECWILVVSPVPKALCLGEGEEHLRFGVVIGRVANAKAVRSCHRHQSNSSFFYSLIRKIIWLWLNIHYQCCSIKDRRIYQLRWKWICYSPLSSAFQCEFFVVLHSNSWNWRFPHFFEIGKLTPKRDSRWFCWGEYRPSFPPVRAWNSCARATHAGFWSIPWAFSGRPFRLQANWGSSAPAESPHPDT